jgi:hypothetical protein
MRALTVRQPWAWTIIHGGKDVENRSRNIAGAYRGPIAIHAAIKPADDDAAIWDMPEYRDRLAAATSVVRHRADIRGAIIGVAQLWAVHQAVPGNFCCPRGQAAWSMPDHWHLCLDGARPIDPIPCNGRLGLWRPPSDVLEQLEAVVS